MKYIHGIALCFVMVIVIIDTGDHPVPPPSMMQHEADMEDCSEAVFKQSIDDECSMMIIDCVPWSEVYAAEKQAEITGYEF